MLAAERGVNLPEDGPKADQTTAYVPRRVSLRLSRRRMVMAAARVVQPMTVLGDAAVPSPAIAAYEPGDAAFGGRRRCCR
jgi:hypothetical protein